MPELPEVETTVKAINKFENKTLLEVVVHNKNLRWKVDNKVELDTKEKLVKKITTVSYTHLTLPTNVAV